MSEPDWVRLSQAYPELLVAALRREHDQGSFALTAQELANAAATEQQGFTEAQALELLKNAGDWLSTEDQPGEADSNYPNQEPPTVTLWVWQDKPRRRTNWLLLVHGMNTTGAWQEFLTFYVGLWQGKVVPTFVHKYGRIVVGVMLPWRRAKLKRQLHDRIVELSKDAPKFNVGPAPDVVAHSFGTWLVGHVLLEELARTKKQQEPCLRLGRVVLTGSILRPDFPWEQIQEAGLVEDVLNHYATSDPIVPLAHWTIIDSGPSGRRGFDLPQPREGAHEVVNVAAPNFGHSQVFSDKERYDSYSVNWKPFLTNPVGKAARGLTLANPNKRWKQAWWPLRGTLLPLVPAGLILGALLWLLLLL